MKWKEEFVTPIPKKAVPEGMNDLRNIFPVLPHSARSLRVLC